MSEILFVTWDGGGNVPPATSIAHELAARGHRVRFLGHAVQRDGLEAQGLEVAPNRRARDFSALTDNSNPLTIIRAFGDRGLAQDVLDEVTRRPADVVVVDCLLFGVMHGLRQAGVPYVVLEHLFDGYLRGSWMRGPMGLGMALKRLGPRRSLAAARATVVTTLPELDPGRATPGLDFVGPVAPGAPRPEDPGRGPAVLVSLSTFAFPGMQACLQRILDACAGLDARVVATTGPVIDPADLTAPPNAELHRFVDHAELMPQVDLVVGHGGHGTTMKALAHDLPMVLMPMHPMLDQPVVAKAVARAGAARVVRRKAASADLAPVIAAMAAPGPHRDAAARLGAAIRTMPGASGAADRIESLVGDGAAVG